MRRNKGHGDKRQTRWIGVCLSAALFGFPSLLFAQTTRPVVAAAVDAPAGEQINFQAAPLGDVLDSVRNRTGLNLIVNWNALATLGIDKTTPITLQVRRITTRKELDLILQTASPSHQLAFYVEDGIVHVTTQELADSKMVTRVYPIGDLLIGHEEFQNVPFINIANQQAATSGGGNVQSPVQSTGQPNPQDVQQERDKRVQAIIHAITSTIRPEIWKQNGGKATIFFFNNNLIVTAPLSVQSRFGG